MREQLAELLWQVVQGLHHQQVELAWRPLGRRKRGERLAAVGEPPELSLGHLVVADQRHRYPSGDEHEEDGAHQPNSSPRSPSSDGGLRSSRASPTMKAVIAAARTGPRPPHIREAVAEATRLLRAARPSVWPPLAARAIRPSARGRPTCGVGELVLDSSERRLRCFDRALEHRDALLRVLRNGGRAA